MSVTWKMEEAGIRGFKEQSSRRQRRQAYVPPEKTKPQCLLLSFSPLKAFAALGFQNFERIIFFCKFSNCHVGNNLLQQQYRKVYWRESEDFISYESESQWKNKSAQHCFFCFLCHFSVIRIK